MPSRYIPFTSSLQFYWSQLHSWFSTVPVLPIVKRVRISCFPYSSHQPTSDNACTKGRNRTHEYRNTNGETQETLYSRGKKFDFTRRISTSTAKLTCRVFISRQVIANTYRVTSNSSNSLECHEFDKYRPKMVVTIL